jgi:hypothetical protein
MDGSFSASEMERLRDERISLVNVVSASCQCDFWVYKRFKVFTELPLGLCAPAEGSWFVDPPDAVRSNEPDVDIRESRMVSWNTSRPLFGLLVNAFSFNKSSMGAFLALNNGAKCFPFACGFEGELSTKDESFKVSSSPSQPRSSLFVLDWKRGKGRDVWEITRRRFSLLGDGETGSPRRRFRARDIAAEGYGGDMEGKVDEEVGSGAKRRGNSSRDGLELSCERDLPGLLNGFGDNSCFTVAFAFCFFILLGEKGLNVERGAVCTIGRMAGMVNRWSGDGSLGGVDGVTTGLESFLYSLYLSAGMNSWWIQRQTNDDSTDLYEAGV